MKAVLHRGLQIGCAYDVTVVFSVMASVFEGLTTELLTECYSSNQEMTIDLLVRPVRTFANLTPLEIAVQANNQSVISHEACQNLLTSIWMGRISDDNPSYRV